MFRTTKAKIIGLIGLSLVVIVALAGVAYTATALAGGASASAATTQRASLVQTAGTQAQTYDEADLRAAIIDMLEDRMGLTGAQAEEWADQMIARMQSAGVADDWQGMLNWCSGYWNDRAGQSAPSGNTNGYAGGGMMGGYYGGGMMGGYGTR